MLHLPRRRDLVLTDYAGHGFTYELAAHLDERGMSVVYCYCASTVAPKAAFGGSVPVCAVRSRRRFDKYRLWQRAVSEIRFGLGAARVVLRERPVVQVVCNMPLLSALILWSAGMLVGSRLVVWLQDLQSGLAEGVLPPGPAVRSIRKLESLVLRRADRVVAISDTLAGAAVELGVPATRVGRLRNWAPVESIPCLEKVNDWSNEHGLAGHFIYLYAGTLARKHSLEPIIGLARSVAHDPDVMVVVVSEGEGADELRRLRDVDAGLDRLLVLDFQPFERLPEVLATADVLLVVLEPLASAHSVPSKTLSYLCAGRPILAAMPRANEASRIIADEAMAGVVVDPDDLDAFVDAGSALRNDPHRRSVLGASGRSYAELAFDRRLVVDSFVRQISQESLDAVR